MAEPRAEVLELESDSGSIVSANSCSPSTSGGEFDVSYSDLVCLEDSQGDSDTAIKVCVNNYKEFFGFPDSRPKSNSKCAARCKFCHKVYKYTLTTKGNLLKHLQTTHERNLVAHKRKQAEELAKPRLPSNQRVLRRDGSLENIVKVPFRNQDKILTSIVKNLCGKGGLPISTVEQEWFREFMKLVEPRFESVSRVAVNSKLEEIYAREMSKLLAEIKASPVYKPTVTVDFWTGCNSRSYMGSTVHYIFEGQLKSHVLFFTEVAPPHSSENIKAHFEEQLDSYELQCFYVVTDNAANMRHAFELMQQRPEDNVGEELEVEDEDDSCLQQWVPTSLKIEGWLGCSAHRLQLVIHDGYTELRSYHRVQSILGKAKAISTLSRRSSHFAYSLSHKIPIPCETRWNSYFHLYEHVLKHFENINMALETVGRKELVLSRPQRDILGLIVDVMSYFNEATNILQREDTPTSNRVIPVIDSLENALIQADRSNPAVNGLSERLLTSLRERFQFLLHSEVYQAAAALDPRVKLTFTDTDNPVSEKVFVFSSSLVKQSIYSMIPFDRPQHSVIPQQEQPSSPPKKTRLLDFSSFSKDRVAKDVSADTELQTFLDQPRLDVNPIAFWSERKETTLSKVALQLLSVPCSSAPVERLFSKAGVILNQRRNRIESGKLEKLVFIK